MMLPPPHCIRRLHESWVITALGKGGGELSIGGSPGWDCEAGVAWPQFPKASCAELWAPRKTAEGTGSAASVIGCPRAGLTPGGSACGGCLPGLPPA